MGPVQGHAWLHGCRRFRSLAVLFLSKVLILKAEDAVFGDRVELGGSVDVLLLAAALTVATEVIQRVYL